MYVCVYVSVFVCASVVCIFICMTVCIYVCHVCVHVCACVYQRRLGEVELSLQFRTGFPVEDLETRFVTVPKRLIERLVMPIA